MSRHPSMKARELRRVLERKPLYYRRGRQTGSHKTLISAADYPPLTWAFHDQQTLPPGLVRTILTRDVGLSGGYSDSSQEGPLSVCLLVHVERVGDEASPPFVWWAESPDLPGFSAAEDYLPALIQSCRRALAELRPGGDVTFRLDAPPPATIADAGDTSEERQTDENPLVVSLVA